MDIYQKIMTKKITEMHCGYCEIDFTIEIDVVEDKEYETEVPTIEYCPFCGETAEHEDD